MDKKHFQSSFDYTFFNLKLDTTWLGRDFTLVDEIDSSNSFLMNSDSQIKANGAVLMAEKQLAGKGRFDRTWFSSKFENLTFSILINDEELLSLDPIVFSFGAIVAVSKALESQYQVKIGIKWPNDLLSDGKKICGVLSERTFIGDRIEKLVIGIGLNVNQTNFQGEYSIQPTSVAKEINSSVSREKLLAEILNEFEELISRSEGTTSLVIKEWKQRCPYLGDSIGIKQNENTEYGIFADVEEDGTLVLRQKDKLLKFNYGDVSLIL